MANRVSRCLSTLETRPQENGALEKGNGPSRYQMRTSRLPSTAALEAPTMTESAETLGRALNR